MALCLKHLVNKFPWLSEIDKLLLGLWKTFHYNSLNRHIFSKLQQAYDLEPRHLVKATVTCWLSHGEACNKRVREWYKQKVLPLDEIISKNSNSKKVSYQSNLLISSPVFQITLLEDISSVTNILCLILQSDRKDFAAVSRAVKWATAILEDIQNNVNSTHLQNFKKADEIIQKLSAIEMRTIVSGTTRKKCKIDTVASTNELHEKVIQTIYYSLSCWNFTSAELPVLQDLLTLDPKSYPDTESEEFQTYGNDSLKILYNYYGSNASNEFQGRFTKSNRLLKCPYDALQLEFGGFKTYADKQKIKIKEENSKRHSFTKSKLELKKGDKYTTRKSICLKKN